MNIETPYIVSYEAHFGFKSAWQREGLLFNWPRLMRNLRAIVPLAFFTALFPVIALAQQEQGWEVKSLNEIIPGAPEGHVEYDMASGAAKGTTSM